MINTLTSIDALASHPSCADHSRRIATDQLIGLNTETMLIFFDTGLYRG